MTPFGEKLRALRTERGILQQDMAAALEVSPAYLSALEHGQRGAPSAGLIHQICSYLGLIWDDADELKALAKLSRPRLKLHTAGLSPEQREDVYQQEKHILAVVGWDPDARGAASLAGGGDGRQRRARIGDGRTGGDERRDPSWDDARSARLHRVSDDGRRKRRLGSGEPLRRRWPLLLLRGRRRALPGPLPGALRHRVQGRCSRGRFRGGLRCGGR